MSLRRWFSISQRANLSLFKLAKYSPTMTRARPQRKYTASGGVGSSVKACSICYWHALPPCLSAARQWTPHCCNVSYCCCQHSPATNMPWGIGECNAYMYNYMQHMIYVTKQKAKGRGNRASLNLNWCSSPSACTSPSSKTLWLQQCKKRGEADSL